MALRESEQRYREIFDNVSDTLYLLEVTPDGRFRNLAVNPAFEKSSGLSRETLIGKFIEESVPEETARIVSDKYRRCIEAGTAYEEEVTLDLPNGRRSYHSTLIPVCDPSGRAYRIVGITRDITLSKQHEELEQRMTHFIANQPGFAFSFRRSPEGHFSFPFASAGIEKMYGLQPEDVKEDSALLHALAHPEDQPRIVAALAESAAALAPFELESRICRPGLPECWIECRSIPLREADGSIVWHGIMLDVSKRKEIERKLEQAYAQVQELAARREEALEAERKRIARDMHDELGQFLTALRLGISVLRMRFADGRPEMLEAVQGVMTLLDRTIQVVRSMATRLRPAPLEMGVVSALEWLAEDFSGRTGIRCTLDAGISEIDMSDNQATAIFRIAQESLTNVVRHAAASQVEICLGTGAESFMLRVRDDGKGFDSSAPRNKSFGLVGIRERAAMLGGEADISSTPGHGTTIEIRIPIQEQKEQP